MRNSLKEDCSQVSLDETGKSDQVTFVVANDLSQKAGLKST